MGRRDDGGLGRDGLIGDMVSLCMVSECRDFRELIAMVVGSITKIADVGGDW